VLSDQVGQKKAREDGRRGTIKPQENAVTNWVPPVSVMLEMADEQKGGAQRDQRAEQNLEHPPAGRD
jgi:hypothetical protein